MHVATFFFLLVQRFRDLARIRGKGRHSSLHLQSQRTIVDSELPGYRQIFAHVAHDV